MHPKRSKKRPDWPTFECEQLHWQNHVLVVGLDEAGRGAWAGPVVAGAAVFPIKTHAKDWSGLTDTKLLNASVREQWYHRIAEELSFGLGTVDANIIDQIGIVPATKLAMLRAIHAIGLTEPYTCLIDAVRFTRHDQAWVSEFGFSTIHKHVFFHQQSLIKGELKSLSIAAGAVVAKVSRDRMMAELDSQYPGYGLAQHKGYGTKQHQQALQTLGVSEVHRFSYRPVGKVGSRK